MEQKVDTGPFAAIYKKVWRVSPPPGYLESAAMSMNVIEFQAHEEAKPAFVKSPLFKEQQEQQMFELEGKMQGA